jgi:hypothetical protein
MYFIYLYIYIYYHEIKIETIIYPYYIIQINNIINFLINNDNYFNIIFSQIDFRLKFTAGF